MGLDQQIEAAVEGQAQRQGAQANEALQQHPAQWLLPERSHRQGVAFLRLPAEAEFHGHAHLRFAPALVVEPAEKNQIVEALGANHAEAAALGVGVVLDDAAGLQALIFGRFQHGYSRLSASTGSRRAALRAGI